MDYKTGLSFYLFSFFTIYQYIYITETFETPTNFHVSTIFKKNIKKKKRNKRHPFTPLIHKTKKPQTLKPKSYFPIKLQTRTCNSLLHLHIHTDRTREAMKERERRRGNGERSKEREIEIRYTQRWK